MVYRWSCPQCRFIVWAPSEDAILDESKRHLVGHFSSVFSQTVFRTTWVCPSCGVEGDKLHEEEAVASFADHLLTHQSDRIASDADILDEIGSPTSVLLLIPEDRRGIPLARSRLLSSSEVVCAVTTDTEGWHTIMERQQASRPQQLILITPPSNAHSKQSFGGRIVHHPLDAGYSVGDLGKVLSQALDAFGDDGLEITVEFDMLAPVIDACDTSTVFRFLHLLEGVFERARASALITMNPAWVPNPTLNVFANLFDLVLVGDTDRLRRYIPPDQDRPTDDVEERTYSEVLLSNQQVIPTGPRHNPYRS